MMGTQRFGRTLKSPWMDLLCERETGSWQNESSGTHILHATPRRNFRHSLRCLKPCLRFRDRASDFSYVVVADEGLELQG